MKLPQTNSQITNFGQVGILALEHGFWGSRKIIMKLAPVVCHVLYLIGT